MKEEDTLKQRIAAEDRPFTDEEWARAKLIPRVKGFRQLLQLSKEEFSAQFGVSVSTLRDWEEGHAEADEAVMEQVIERVRQAKEEYFGSKSGPKH